MMGHIMHCLTLLCLLVGAWQDARTRTIHVVPFVGCSLLAIVWQITQKAAFSGPVSAAVYLAMLTLVIEGMWLACRWADGRMGAGDFYVLFLLLAASGWIGMLKTCLFAGILACVATLPEILRARMYHRIPFVPYLFFGYCIYLLTKIS